ncbi:response regulator [Desulfobacterales bacterium HSG2]|nr:response regulator [Desulfobacterales bacterium HSG2]
MKILIVDDQQSIRKAMILILRRLGITDVVQGEDPYEALTHLKKEKFDLIISDVHMPSPLPGVPAKSGIELLKAVKQVPALEKIPFLIVSTDSEMKTVVKAMQSGVSGYIIKPFTEKAVREKLEMLGFEIKSPEPEDEPPPKPAASSHKIATDDDFLKTTF